MLRLVWAMIEEPPIFNDQFYEEFEQLLKWRRDVRVFDKRSLAPGMFESLLEQALTYSPSVGNSQPWRFVRVKSQALRRSVRDHVEAEYALSAEIYDGEVSAHFRRLKLHGLSTAPEQLAVFSLANPEEGKGLGRQTMPKTLEWSTVMAIHTLWLAARAKGVGIGWVSILRPDEITRLLDCPPDWHFVAYLCMGYPGNESQTPDLVTDKWQDRLPLGTLLTEK